MLPLADLRADPDIQPVFLSPPPTPDYLTELALAKRFCERWRGDASFREQLEQAPDETLEAAGLPLSGRDLRGL